MVLIWKVIWGLELHSCWRCPPAFSYSFLPTLHHRGNAYNAFNIFSIILNHSFLKQFDQRFWFLEYVSYLPPETGLWIGSPNTEAHKNIWCLLYHWWGWKAKSTNSGGRAETIKAGEFWSARECRLTCSRERSSFAVSLRSKYKSAA